MKNTSISLAAIVVATLALAGRSGAQLVDRGTTTLDSQSGLDWLDVTQTLGVSAYEILVLGYGGYVADGWTLATVEQIDELFLHAGIPLPHDGTLTPRGYAGTSQLIQLLGASGSSGSGAFIQAFSGTLVAAQPPFLRHTPVLLTSGSVGGADLMTAVVPSSVNNPTIGSYLVRPAGPTTIQVPIDIKPGSSHNPVNPNSKGTLWVAVLSTSALDAHDIDVPSVRFGPAGAPPIHEKGYYADVNGDGDVDLLLHFQTQATGIECKQTSAALIGLTHDGLRIEGEDAIVTVGCGR